MTYSARKCMIRLLNNGFNRKNSTRVIFLSMKIECFRDYDLINDKDSEAYITISTQE